MLVVATAGHVDHGKSSLVRALTGADPDRFAEEKSRGLTIDIGFASMSRSDREVSFIDVPGHVRFIKNMLTGVGSIRTALFVVAATEGWKPQSEEHLRILDLLRFERGIIAMTKIHDVEPELLELARLEIAEAVEGTFLESAEVFEVDSIKGVGIEEIKDALFGMAQSDDLARSGAPLRLWIDRSFSVKGSGDVVTGTLTGGSLSVGQELQLFSDRSLPSPSMCQIGPRKFARVLLDQRWTPTVKVRQLQSHGRFRDEVPANSRVAVNLSGADPTRLVRGGALLEGDKWLMSATFDATVEVLPKLRHSLSRKGSYAVYIGSTETSARIRILDKTGQIDPSQTGTIRVFLPRYLPIRPGDRFIIRESGRGETVAGGEVLDVVVTNPAPRSHPTKNLGAKLSELEQVELDHLIKFAEYPKDVDLDEFIIVSKYVLDRGFANHLLTSVINSVHTAGPEGIDLSALSPIHRTLAERSSQLRTVGTRLVHMEYEDAALDVSRSPLLAQLDEGGLAPPQLPLQSRGTLRELVRRGLAVEADGIFFATSAVEAAKLEIYALAGEMPSGFTASDIRQRLGTTRKYLLPLLGLFDRTGITRRDGDLRTLGPVGLREASKTAEN